MSAYSLGRIENEVTNLLCELVRIDTTNPPGNEIEAAKYLSETLNTEGFKCELYESAPGRGSIITRLNGTREKPRLLLLSHLDVVAANSKDWSVDPFSGTIKDGFVWGRGTLDMKGMTAIEVMALKLLKRNKVKLKGDVILAATADEEMGGMGGVEYLLGHYPDKIFAEYVLNEGGGSSIPIYDKTLFTIGTAEKGLLWFKIRTRGISGHASMPDEADNAIMGMNKVIERLGNYCGEIKLVPPVKQFLMEIASEDKCLQPLVMRILRNPRQSDTVLGELEKSSPAVADEIRPRLRMTIAPTIIRGGVRKNVIPSECMAIFDCRVLPGHSIDEALASIRELLRDADLDKFSFEDIQAEEPSESPMDTPLYDTIKGVLEDFEPECGVAPILMTGLTDSRFFRRLGSVCYGFHPMRSETRYDSKPIRREHGIDERISIANLVFGTSVLYETIKRFMT